MLKKSRLLFLVALSAISYALPFTTPTLWWLIFFFPLPILVAPFDTLPTEALRVSEKINLSFWHGFIWGLIAYGVQLYPVYGGVASLASAPSLYPFLLVAGLAIYLSFYSGVWFWVIRKNSLLISAIAGTVYIHWIDAYCLWPLLRIEGYPFAHPLIPLTAYPPLLFFLPLLGKQLFTFFIFVPAGLATLFLFSQHQIFSKHKTIAGTVLLLFCSSLAILFFSPPTISTHTISRPAISPIYPKAPLRAFQASLDLSQIAHLPLQAKGESSSLAELVSHKLKKIVGEKPETQLIILPESALYTVLHTEINSPNFKSPEINAPDLKTGIAGTAPVCKTPDCAKIWSAESLGKPISLVCGGFKKNKHNQVLNTCYLFHDGVLMYEYAKTHTIPFAEQMPAWLSTASLESLFFSELAAIIPGDNQRAPFIIPRVGTFVPVICSELFFSQKIDGHENLPLLALVNDARFESEVFRELMLKTAQVKAIEWQREILYISYAYGVLIGKNGGMWERLGSKG